MIEYFTSLTADKEMSALEAVLFLFYLRIIY